MDIIEQTDLYRIYWHDEDHSIVVLDVLGQWDWNDAHIAIREVNSVVEESSIGIYTIHRLTPGVSLVPKGGNAIPNIRNLLSYDPANEQLVIFVGAPSFLKALISVAGKLGGIVGSLSKTRFVPTMDDALEMIEAHKKEHNPSPDLSR